MEIFITPISQKQSMLFFNLGSTIIRSHNEKTKQ